MGESVTKIAIYGQFSYADIKWYLLTLPYEYHLICNSYPRAGDICIKAFASDYGRPIFKTKDPYSVADVILIFDRTGQSLKYKYPHTKLIHIQ